MKQQPVPREQRREFRALPTQPLLHEPDEAFHAAAKGGDGLPAGEGGAHESHAVGIAADRPDDLASLLAEPQLVDGAVAAALRRDEPLRAERVELIGEQAEFGKNPPGLGERHRGGGHGVAGRGRIGRKGEAALIERGIHAGPLARELEPNDHRFRCSHRRSLDPYRERCKRNSGISAHPCY
ncbi:MAG: hypothetical protein WD066_01630 [Planctomycetaceae bacterium]